MYELIEDNICLSRIAAFNTIRYIIELTKEQDMRYFNHKKNNCIIILCNSKYKFQSIIIVRQNLTDLDIELKYL